MPNQKRRQPSPGDLTGKRGAALEAQHAEEIKQREGEISMARQAEVDMNQNGVFDPETGDLIEDDGLEEVSGPLGFGPTIGDPGVVEITDDEAGDDFASGYETIGGDDDVIEVPAPEPPRQQVRQAIIEQRPDPEPVQVERVQDERTEIVRGEERTEVVDRGFQVVKRADDDMVIARVNSDIDQMTFGVGNHYSFEAGKKYKMPRAMAQHLDRLGYIWH